MAYNIVSIVATNLSQLLMNGANFLFGVKVEEVQSLLIELQHVRNLLKNSKERGIMDADDKIKNIAHEVEDIVETYAVNFSKKRRRNKAVKFFCCFSMTVTMTLNVREKIQQLKTIRAEEEKKNWDMYGVQQTKVYQYDELRRHLRSLIEVGEDDVVGFIEETQTLMNHLIEGNKELNVISISGMGGLGKTTLARKVYKDSYVKKHFGCRAWVNVSQKLNLKELLLEILKEVTQITAEITGMRVEKLKQELYQKLSYHRYFALTKRKNHRYLVVLDDMWDSKLWDELKEVFPDDENGSRVLVTTRYRQVAFHASGKPPLELKFLNLRESRELFARKVFKGERYPMSLEHLGEKFIAKCEGLPLAIVLLGDVLATREKTEQTWKSMVRDMEQHLTNKTLCFLILGLSYWDLPLNLQPCFLYLGLFPEDYEIPARWLIQLWISEGFIQHEDNDELKKEDVAESYLEELIDRNLIQVKKRRSNGGVKTCHVHRLIRDLCLQLSEDQKFLEPHSSVPSKQAKPRRLSIHCSFPDYISKVDHSNFCFTRTLLCFKQGDVELAQKDWKSLFQCIKLVRVLDLGDKEVRGVPKAIEKLTLLKYLRVKTAHVTSSIFSFHSLQTLDLRSSQINLLPGGLWSMQQLRHLYLSGGTNLPANIGKKRLFNLQTLYYVSADRANQVDISESAPNLRKLGFYGYHCRSSDVNLPRLECLKLANGCTFDELIKLPPTVTKISIKSNCLQPKIIRVLLKLSALQLLKLDSLDDDVLVFQEGWFPKLQFLKIKNSSIKRLELKEGAVPKLKRVEISHCLQLTMLPKELWDLPKLEKLELLSLPSDLTDTIAQFKKSDHLEVVIDSC